MTLAHIGCDEHKFKQLGVRLSAARRRSPYFIFNKSNIYKSVSLKSTQFLHTALRAYRSTTVGMTVWPLAHAKSTQCLCTPLRAYLHNCWAGRLAPATCRLSTGSAQAQHRLSSGSAQAQHRLSSGSAQLMTQISSKSSIYYYYVVVSSLYALSSAQLSSKLRAYLSSAQLSSAHLRTL